MNERVVALVSRLMKAHPPDMMRSREGLPQLIGGDHGRQGGVKEDFICPCYSTAQLMLILDDQDLVNALCRANEGVPIWPESVRNFLLGWLA